jgi:hypothetical protein
MGRSTAKLQVVVMIIAVAAAGIGVAAIEFASR